MLRDLVTDVGSSLSPAERRVADVVLANSQLVAFGTVAELADAARSSGATVIRLASKLGFSGFTALQEAVQEEMAQRLRPAAERIREPAPADLIGRTMERELANVHGTLAELDRTAIEQVVGWLAGAPEVHVLSGEASRGVATQFAAELGQVRDRVQLMDGSTVKVARALALAEPGALCVVIDLRRYERWVLETVNRVAAAGMRVVAITDSPIAPLAANADVTFPVVAHGAGIFDSHVGILALTNALTAAAADVLRTSAGDRLERIEQAWRAGGELVDEL